MRNALSATEELPAAGRQEIPLEDFEDIVREHQRRIYRILHFLVRDPDKADTLTQECFLRAYARRSGFRGEASPGTWLMRIAINLAKDHLKSRRQTFWRRLVRGKEALVQSLQVVGRTPEDTILARERVAEVWTAVEALPIRQRTAFTLRFAEEMSIAEIAAAMNVREGTVKANLASAIQAVRTGIRLGFRERLAGSGRARAGGEKQKS